MQETEFNKLFKPGAVEAKWADMGKLSQIAPVMVKKQIRKEIKRHEEVIPRDLRSEIDRLIKKLRADGFKETKIKRIVKNTFRITVI